MADIPAAERRAAAWTWAASGPFGPVIPLMLLMAHRRSAFVAHHAAQAVLSYGFLMAAAVGGVFVMLGAAALHLAEHGAQALNEPAPPLVQASTVVVGAGILLVYATQIVASLVMARRAFRGEEVCYPLVHRAIPRRAA